MSMDSNPYAPPKAAVADAVERLPTEVSPDTMLYSVGQITLATFLGAPLAGGWLIARNYKALGQPEKAGMNLFWSIVGTLVLIGLAFVLPDNFPNIGISVVSVIAVKSWADAQFGKLLGRHRAANGKVHSWWRAVGIGVLCLAIMITAIMIVVFLLYMLGILVD